MSEKTQSIKNNIEKVQDYCNPRLDILARLIVKAALNLQQRSKQNISLKTSPKIALKNE